MRVKRILSSVTIAAALLVGCKKSSSTASSTDAILAAGDLDALKKKLAAGLDANAPLADGKPPLVHAVWAGKPELVSALLDSKADPMWRSAERQTLLHIAAAANKPEVFPPLIAAGVPTDATDAEGNQPIHSAAISGSVESVRALVERHGVDPLARRPDGANPRSLAKRLEAKASLAYLDGLFAIPLTSLPSPLYLPLESRRGGDGGSELLPSDPEALVREAFECQLLRKPDEENIWLEAQPDMVALYYANIGLCWDDQLPAMQRVEGYHERNCAGPATSRAALARLVDRRPQALRSLFDRYKPFLFRAMPVERYRRTRMPALLDSLLASHERLKADPETPKKLAEAYAALEKFHTDSEREAYYWCAAVDEVDPEMPADEFRSCWLKSFWVRREKEGNREVVAQILEEVRAHYAALSHVGLNTKAPKAPACTEELDEPFVPSDGETYEPEGD